jgi:hypothetical protein
MKDKYSDNWKDSWDSDEYQGRSKKQVQYSEMVVNMVLTLAVIGALVSLALSLLNIR